MGEFFAKLLDTGDFPARWYCGQWTESLGWLHIVSDLLIFAAYAAIPAVLTFFVIRRKDVPFPPIFWLFALFILSCGTGHLVEATIFWRPWYRLSGLVKVLTAAVSWVAVVGLAQIMPQALALPGLAKVNNELKDEIEQRRRAEQRFRIVIEAAPSAMLLADETGRIVLVNSNTEAMFGYSRHELLGQPVEMLLPERYREAHPALRQQFFQSPSSRLMGAGRDLAARRKDGTEFPVEIGLNPIDAGEGRMALSAIVDISDRKRVEDAMTSVNKMLELEVAHRTRLVTLRHDIAAICNQAESVEIALRNAITRICLHLRWPVGHVFLRNPHTGRFESSCIWVRVGDVPEPLTRIAELTHDVNFALGEDGWDKSPPRDCRNGPVKSAPSRIYCAPRP